MTFPQPPKCPESEGEGWGRRLCRGFCAAGSRAEGLEDAAQAVVSCQLRLWCFSPLPWHRPPRRLAPWPGPHPGTWAPSLAITVHPWSLAPLQANHTPLFSAESLRPCAEGDTTCCWQGPQLGDRVRRGGQRWGNAWGAVPGRLAIGPGHWVKRSAPSSREHFAEGASAPCSHPGLC